GPGWDACLVGFRTKYQLDWRTCLAEMPLVDLAPLITGLEQWGYHEENTARLLEQQAYALQLRWNRLTVDPDDPDVREQQARRDAAGLRPPPSPPVPPVAMRPPAFAAEAYAAYAEITGPYRLPDTEADHEEADDPDAVLNGWLLTNGYA
ncbi:MAG: hypothetical protein M3443_16055, partial [Actinomycetota bacterium]|nr:hypothetical protein [Actinomycetota bacterium]